jgi:hypothetical protein
LGVYFGQGTKGQKGSIDITKSKEKIMSCCNQLVEEEERKKRVRQKIFSKAFSGFPTFPVFGQSVSPQRFSDLLNLLAYCIIQFL